MARRKIQVFFKTARIWLVGLLLLLSFFISINAQQSGTTQYFYDDNGRLVAVVAPNGEAVIYDYDSAGNFLAIRRLPAGTLVLLSFSPHEGVPGDSVVFAGAGFVAGQTSVFFNGAAAQVTEADTTRIVAIVPNGATTGLVTISTPNGSVSTPTPFVVRGIKITPSSGRILFAETLQLTATVYSLTPNQAVQWSVDGIVGGNTNVGTVSSGGLYTAPSRTGTFTIRASLVDDPTIYAEALIESRDPNNLQAVFAAVSVRRGLSSGTSTVAQAVSVRKGGSFANNTISQAVSVRRGLSNGSGAVSSPVSVLYGNSSRANPLSSGVSVRFGFPYGSGVFSSAVSVSNAPNISGISPATIQRGTAANITITGNNLNDVAGLTFINADTGLLITNIAVSNIVVNPEGTILTATLTVPSNAVLSRITIVARTSGQGSLTTNTGNNTIQIIQ